MKGKLFLAAIFGASIAPCVLMAQAPAGATGKCKDGTYTTAPSKSGACKGHKGVATWTGASTSAKTATSSATTPAAPAAATKPATPATKPTTSTAAKTSLANKAAAPGGGPGQVWVNTGSSTKAYHCPGDKYYGKTKAGKYMSESDAKAAGYHAAGGKACSAN
jgi:hypothetical protein